MSSPCSLRVGAMATLVTLSLGGCFDSDQKIVVAPVGSTSTGEDTTTAATSTGPLESTSTGEPPPRTCRDTLACTLGCVLLAEGEGNQLDVIFACLLECEPPTVPEAIDVFRLIGCVTEDCIDQGRCDLLLPDEDDDGTSSSSGGSSSSSGSSSSGSSSSGSSSTGDSSSTGGSSSTGTTTGSSSSSSSSTGDASSSSTGEPVDPQTECLSCLLGGLSEPSMLPMDYACYAEAVACE